jgi:hypothetical protein
MSLLDLSTAIAALFIIGMIWLRTRMQYVGLVRGASGRGASGHKLQLEKAGRLYFASAVALLVVGWFVAPPLGATFWPATAANAAGIGGNPGGIGGQGTVANGTVAHPTLTRVIWFLLTYYVFIVIHRVLKSRGVGVFKVHGATV